MKNREILITGSIAIDNIKTPFGEVKGVLGGSASYSSMAASLFAPVRLLGVAGSDFPQEYLAKFEARGIDVSGLKICEGKTFSWTGFYGDNVNEAKTLSVCPDRLKDPALRIPEHYSESEYVFLANTDPEIQQEVLDNITAAKVTVADTMNLWIKDKPQQLKKLLSRIDIMLINETEAKMLSGHINLVSAAKAIMEMGPGVVIIKKGEHGVLMKTADDLFVIPAYPVEFVKDPTGAGDSFAGAFVGSLASSNKLDSRSLRKAVVLGTIAASFAVEDFSTDKIESVSGADIKQRFREFCQIVQF